MMVTETRVGKILKATFTTFFTTALAIGALAGCGPMGTDTSGYKKSFHDTYNTAGIVDSGCHPIDSPNVVPVQDTTNDGTRSYSTCFDSASPSIVKVYGKSSRSTWVCAYPITTTSVTNFRPVTDVNGLPVSQCWNAATFGSTGQNLNFYFTGFNGLIVVDYSQRTDMSRCLMNQQTCPIDFAIGTL